MERSERWAADSDQQPAGSPPQVFGPDLGAPSPVEAGSGPECYECCGASPALNGGLAGGEPAKIGQLLWGVGRRDGTPANRVRQRFPRCALGQPTSDAPEVRPIRRRRPAPGKVEVNRSTESGSRTTSRSRASPSVRHQSARRLRTRAYRPAIDVPGGSRASTAERTNAPSAESHRDSSTVRGLYCSSQCCTSAREWRADGKASSGSADDCRRRGLGFATSGPPSRFRPGPGVLPALPGPSLDRCKKSVHH